MIKHALIISLLALQVLTAQESEVQQNKWSLGISYQPNSTAGNVTRIYDIDEWGDITYNYYFATENNTAIYFTRSIIKNVWAYLSVDYSLVDYYYQNKMHRDYVDLNSNDYDSGREDTFKEISLSIFAGGKIFFKTPKPKKVSPYIVLGIGKRITYHSSESKDLYNSNDDSENISGDEYDDYYGKIKSPIFIFGKGGAEYYFNSSISITAELELLFQKSEGKRNYTYTNKDNDGNINYTKDYKIHKKESAISQSAKIGLNFYF